MKKSETIFQKLFSGMTFGNSRIPLRSNVFNKGGGRGYSVIGGTGMVDSLTMNVVRPY